VTYGGAPVNNPGLSAAELWLESIAEELSNDRFG